MSDPKTPEAKPEDDKFEAHLKGEHHQAKKGVKDGDRRRPSVTSAGGEPLSGRIADITRPLPTDSCRRPRPSAGARRRVAWPARAAAPARRGASSRRCG